MLRHRTPKEQSVVVVLAIVSTTYVVSLKLRCTFLTFETDQFLFLAM
jgi:hypothetical protein